MAALCILQPQSNWIMQSQSRQIYSCFASLTRGNGTCSLFLFLTFSEVQIFFFLFMLRIGMFAPSIYPSCWLMQIQRDLRCLGQRLIFRARVREACFPPLCLPLLISQWDWSHNCLNKNGHHLPSVFTTGNEANCPRGRKWLLLCRDTDDDFEKGWKRGDSYSLLRGSLWHQSVWECK